MKYIIDIPNEMVIKSALNGLTLGIAMIETSTQKQFIIPTNISLMPYTEPQKWIPCSECEKRCSKWENSKTSQD